MLPVLLALAFGAPPVKPSPQQVIDAASVKEQMGNPVTVVGQLERVPLSKGKGEFVGTALVLDDDTLVYLTYGEPPKGFEALVGARLKVEGLLRPSIDDQSQSLVAPHLRAPGSPVKDVRQPSALLGQRVRLSGIARNAKGGAVLLLGDSPVYLQGVESWPLGVDQKLVGVGGKLVSKRYLPEATRDAKGAISQGTSEGSTQWVLEAPVWRVIEEVKR
jgi:hypothetical protein